MPRAPRQADPPDPDPDPDPDAADEAADLGSLSGSPREPRQFAGDDAAGDPGSGADSSADPDPDSGQDSVPDPRQAAASALARARKAARDRGLRPGSKPTGRRRRDPLDQGRGRDGRDPALLGDQLDRLLLDRGWNADVAVGSVMGRWPSIVGADVAAHCTPVTFEDGILTVRCDSTAWATNLRLMSATLMGRLESEAGEGVVTEVRVHGPSAPSWKRGPRRSRGPGPRDTYG